MAHKTTANQARGKLLVFSLVTLALAAATADTHNVASGTTETMNGVTETSRTVKTGDGTLAISGANSLKSMTVSAGTVKFSGGTTSISDSSATGTGSSGALFVQDAGNTIIDGAAVTASAGTYVIVNNGILLVTNATFDATGIGGQVMNAFSGNNSECRIVITDGGVMKANIIRPSGTDNSSQKENVSIDLKKGGELYMRYFWTDWSAHRYGRINFDGGRLFVTEAATGDSTALFYYGRSTVPWTNKEIQPTVRGGGFYLHANGANWIYPAVVSGAEHDGGVHVSGNDTLYWYANGSTYNGGTWLESDNNATFALSSSYGGDAALGAVPSTPTTNIWVTGAKHALFSGSGTVSIHPNRNVFIPNGGQMLLGTQGRLVIGGEIKGEAVGGLDYPTNTCLDVYFAATEHGDWNGTVVVGPGEGRTNDVGRMRVGACLEVASGVTRVSASSRFATGENAAMVFVAGNNTSYNDAKGHLVVNGGTLTTAQSERFVIVRNYGHLEVTNGGKVDMPFVTYVNGLSRPGTTTIDNGGELCVTNFQFANGSTSILNLKNGGMLASYQFWNNGSTATVNFDGGGLRWFGSRDNCFTQGSAGTVAGDWGNTTLAVKEGGAVLDVRRNLFLSKPLQSGAEHDGGLIKRGTAVLVLTTPMGYNGPTRVEAGTIQARVDNAIPVSTLILTNNGHIAFSKYDSDNYVNYTHTEQTLHRVEGSGTVEYCRNVHVTNSIAPSVGGTLTFEYPCEMAGDFEVKGDANGCGKIFIRRDIQDISGLTLKVADFSALDEEKGRSRNGTTEYQILSVGNGAGYSGEFKLPADWSSNWVVKYTSNGAYLRYKTGTAISIR